MNRLIKPSGLLAACKPRAMPRYAQMAMSKHLMGSQSSAPNTTPLHFMQSMQPLGTIPGARSFSSEGTSTVIEMKDSGDWDKYLESDKPVVLQAGAHWCGPCQFLKPMLTKVSAEYADQVMYVYMDIDKFPEIAEMLEI